MVGRPLEQVYPRTRTGRKDDAHAVGHSAASGTLSRHPVRHVPQRDPHRSRRRDRGPCRPRRCRPLGIGPCDLRTLPDRRPGRCGFAAATGGRPTRASRSAPDWSTFPKNANARDSSSSTRWPRRSASAFPIGSRGLDSSRRGPSAAAWRRRSKPMTSGPATRGKPSPRSAVATSKRLFWPAGSSAGRRSIILDEPTRGVDVGAKSQIHALVDSLAAKGKGILFISSDLGEIVGMSDRILVMNRGTIETELCGDADDGAQRDPGSLRSLSARICGVPDRSAPRHEPHPLRRNSLLAADAQIGPAADRFSHRRQRGHSRLHRLAYGGERNLVCRRSVPHGLERGADHSRGPGVDRNYLLRSD